MLSQRGDLHYVLVMSSKKVTEAKMIFWNLNSISEERKTKLCVRAWSQIALWNRIRSLAVSRVVSRVSTSDGDAKFLRHIFQNLPPWTLFLVEFNSVHSLTLYLFEIHFKNILYPRLGYQVFSSLQVFRLEYYVFYLLHVCYMPRPLCPCHFITSIIWLLRPKTSKVETCWQTED